MLRSAADGDPAEGWRGPGERAETAPAAEEALLDLRESLREWMRPTMRFQGEWAGEVGGEAAVLAIEAPGQALGGVATGRRASAGGTAHSATERAGRGGARRGGTASVYAADQSLYRLGHGREEEQQASGRTLFFGRHAFCCAHAEKITLPARLKHSNSLASRGYPDHLRATVILLLLQSAGAQRRAGGRRMKGARARPVPRKVKIRGSSLFSSTCGEFQKCRARSAAAAHLDSALYCSLLSSAWLAVTCVVHTGSKTTHSSLPLVPPRPARPSLVPSPHPAAVR